MTELTEREARELAGSLRPRRRPFLIAVTANAVMAVLFFGVPYVRGRMLAEAKRNEFVGFVQCMIGGRVNEHPGLSLPRGEREHYAAKVLFANSDWPMACRAPLKRLEPPDAIFLWPSLKVAGADLHDAIELVDRELASLAKRRVEARGRVPQRPLDALKRLQAATVLYARAADVASDIDADCVILDQELGGLTMPSRLPLMIGENQGLLPWSEAGALSVLAFDSRSLAYLHVDNGKVDRQRVRRNAFMRGVTRAGDTPYLVWAMPESRCAERQDRCTRRPTALSSYEKSSSELDEPTWKLPGHPAERLDRGLHVSPMGRIDFLRRSSARGGIEWIRARLPDTLSSPAVEQGPQMLTADAVWSIVEIPELPVTAAAQAAKPPAAPDISAVAPSGAGPGEPQPAGAATGTAQGDSKTPDEADDKTPAPPMIASSAVLSAEEPALVLHATEVNASVVAALTIGNPGNSGNSDNSGTQAENTIPLESAHGSKPWTAMCTSGSERWLAYGSSEELHMARFTSQQGVSQLAVHAIALGVPIDPDDSGADRLRLLCEPGRSQLLFVGRDRKLEQLVCDAASCGEPRALVADVAEFDAVLQRGLGLIAFQQGPLSPTIKLLRLDQNLSANGQPAVAGTCWEPLGGMCGRPTLVSDAQRTVLLTRDGPDLLALETVNNGRTLAPLSGVAVNHLLDSSTTSPLQQHRKRKGID